MSNYMSLEDVVRVGGQYHQIGLRMIQELMNKGGDWRHVSRLLSPQFWKVFEEVARQVMGGPWTRGLVDTPVSLGKYSSDLGPSLEELEGACENQCIFRHPALRRKGHEEPFFQEDAWPPFTPVSYKLVAYPKPVSYADLLADRHREEWATYRELLAYVQKVETGECTVVSLAPNLKDDGKEATFPRFIEKEDGDREVNWWTLREDQKFPPGTFFLLRIFRDEFYMQDGKLNPRL